MYTASGTATALRIDVPGVTAYVAGAAYMVLPRFDNNSEATTISINGLEAIPVYRENSEDAPRLTALNGSYLYIAQSGDRAYVVGVEQGDIADIKLTARPAAPARWLLCQGQAISRTTYARLFAAIGTTYGAGNGSTTFNLPNLCGRVPVGMDTEETEFNTLGKTGGEKTHTLTSSENGQHSHSATGNVRNSGDQFNTTLFTTSSVSTASTGYGTSYSSLVTVASSGSGAAHNNLQPYVTLNYIIYTGVA